jgi:hypothetical protein
VASPSVWAIIVAAEDGSSAIFKSLQEAIKESNPA